MNHDTIKERLLEFYDGEMFESELTLVRSHLNICDECRQTLNEWKALSATFFAGVHPEASEKFVLSVMNRIDEKESFNLGELIRQWFAPALGLSFASLVLFFTFSSLTKAVSTEDLLFNDSSTEAPSADADVLSLLQI